MASRLLQVVASSSITTDVDVQDDATTKSSHVKKFCWSTLPPALKVRENRCEDCGGLGLVAKSTRYTKVHEDGTLNGEPYGDAICRRCDGTGLNLITCQRCGERTLPAMKHAVFCKPCSDALVEEANKPADLSADDLFARIAKNNAWR